MTATHDLTEVPQDVRDALTAFLRATADAGYTGAHVTATTTPTYVNATLTVQLPPAAIPITITVANPHDADLALVATIPHDQPVAPCARYDYQTGRADFVHTRGPCTLPPPGITSSYLDALAREPRPHA